MMGNVSTEEDCMYCTDPINCIQHHPQSTYPTAAKATSTQIPSDTSLILYK